MAEQEQRVSQKLDLERVGMKISCCGVSACGHSTSCGRSYMHTKRRCHLFVRPSTAPHTMKWVTSVFRLMRDVIRLRPSGHTSSKSVCLLWSSVFELPVGGRPPCCSGCTRRWRSKRRLRGKRRSCGKKDSRMHQL